MHKSIQSFQTIWLISFTCALIWIYLKCILVQSWLTQFCLSQNTYLHPLLPLFFSSSLSLTLPHPHPSSAVSYPCGKKSRQLQRLTKKEKSKQIKKAVFPAIKRFSAPQKKVAATIIPANYLRPPQASPVSTVTHGTHSRWDAHHHGNLNPSPVPQCP